MGGYYLHEGWSVTGCFYSTTDTPVMRDSLPSAMLILSRMLTEVNWVYYTKVSIYSNWWQLNLHIPVCQELPHISSKQHINRTLLQKKHFHFLIPPRCTGVLKIASCCMLGGMLSVHILVGRVGYSIHIQCPQLWHFICYMFPSNFVLSFSLFNFNM